MRKRSRKLSLVSLLLLIVMFATMSIDVAEAKNKGEILVLGEDLDEKTVEDLKVQYEINYPVKELIVTNKEEHEALGKYIDKDIITNKSMSSALIKNLKKGEGIKVETKNINWVTEDMYANALLTAGVKDAEVTVIGPFPVSGTAALTGIIRAYEDMTGKEISEEQKDVANDEMVTTAELSDNIGVEKAEELITQIKIYIIQNNITNPEEIRQTVEDTMRQLDISADPEMIESISALMERISKLDIDVNAIKEQLGNILDKLGNIEIDQAEVKGFLSQILSKISSFFSRIFG